MPLGWNSFAAARVKCSTGALDPCMERDISLSGASHKLYRILEDAVERHASLHRILDILLETKLWTSRLDT